jgi:hypothetical protein
MKKTSAIIINLILAINLGACEERGANNSNNKDTPALIIEEKAAAKLPLPKNRPNSNQAVSGLEQSAQNNSQKPKQKKLAGKYVLAGSSCDSTEIVILNNENKYIAHQEAGNWQLKGDLLQITSNLPEEVTPTNPDGKFVISLKLVQENKKNIVLQREDGSNVLWDKCQ